MMKIISCFESVNNKKMYFSPEIYSNRGSSFRLRPQEKALLIFNSHPKNNNSTNQYKVKFSKSHFYTKKPSYKFMICIQNISKHRRILCKSGCLLTTLLEYQCIRHWYSNISHKDLYQARRYLQSSC